MCATSRASPKNLSRGAYSCFFYQVGANIAAVFALLEFAIWFWNTFLINVVMLYIILMHISHFMFFLLMTYYLLFISYLFWTMEMMLDNQIWAIFSFEFKMNHKAVETTQWCTGPGTVDECTVQWWFKKFYKGDKSLEDEECSGRPPKLTMINWDDHRPDPYNYMRSCQKTQHQPFYSCSEFEANGKGKKAW